MIRLLIVDDQAMVRELLKSYLDSDSDIVVVGEADNGKAALEQLDRVNPDVIVMDIEMPEIDGIATTRMVLQKQPGAKVLVVSSHYDDVYLARALRNGARGYLLKTTAAEDLASAIHAVDRGYLQFGSGVLEQEVAQSTFASVREVAQHAPLATATVANGSRNGSANGKTARNGSGTLAGLESGRETHQPQLELSALEHRLEQIEKTQTRLEWFQHPQETNKELSRLRQQIGDLQGDSSNLHRWNKVLSLIVIALLGGLVFQAFSERDTSVPTQFRPSAESTVFQDD